MPAFETLKCPDCRANFAVESRALNDDVEEVICPLCESRVEVESEDAMLNPEDEEDEAIF